MRKTLGRGLDALIPTGPLGSVTMTPAAVEMPPNEVDIDRIHPNRYQPRERFDADKLEELAESVRQNGVLQPLLVTPRGDDFELVAGERRWRAARLAGLKKVPVLVREVDARESLKLALLENVQREDLNPIEEARGYQRLIEEFEMTQLELAERIGKARSAVANTLRLLQLPADIQDRIHRGEITAGHARALLGASTLEEQREVASLVRERALSVRDAEALLHERRGTRSKRRSGAAAVAPNPALQELERRLEQRFGTRVRIHARKTDGSAGRIEIEYYSSGELERIFAAAGVSYLL
jgi:ParB family chromosome partitioning protein